MLNKVKTFTLIELLIVVAIIGILATVGVLLYQNYIDTSKSKASEIQTTLKLIEGLANEDNSTTTKGAQLPNSAKICPDAGCNGPYTVYSSDPCQNPYKGGENKKLVNYFMKIRCQAAPKGISCNNPHAVRKSWKGRVLKYGDRGPMQCN